MSRPIVVLGDKTSHGGTVIGADFTSDIHGKYMARVGDMVVCPKCKGVFAITSGASDMVDGEGRGYARHMDTTACGARLISGQITTTWSDESSLGDPATELPNPARGPGVLEETRGIAHNGLWRAHIRPHAHFCVKR